MVTHWRRLEDMLDESQVALAESQGELAGLKQVVCMLEEEIAQLDSASSNALIEASLADELTTGGARGNTHDVESLQRQIHSMLATAEVALGISHVTSESCVVRLKHLLNDVTARAANESNARCVAKQTISELTEQQRASELEIERMNLMLKTMTSHQRPRRAAQATGSVEPDEYLKTLDTLEAQVNATPLASLHALILCPHHIARYSMESLARHLCSLQSYNTTICL